MAARANLVINDNQATPVAHTFNPNSGDGNIPGVSVISYEDRSGGIAVGFPSISISTRRPSKTNRNYKFTFLIKNPILETVSNSTVTGIAPAPTKSYECVARVEMILPERSSLQSRKDLKAYLINFLQTAVVTSIAQDFEAPW